MTHFALRARIVNAPTTHPSTAHHLPASWSGSRLAYLDQPLELECGERLDGVTLAYETWGELSPARDNAVLICHALTGDAHAGPGSPEAPRPGWWQEQIGPGKALDPADHYIICSNVLGGCAGSSGPRGAGGFAGRGTRRFPPVTIGDMVRAQRRLLDDLGVRRLRLVTGGSMGGMQAVEWLVAHPAFTERAVIFAAPPSQPPLAIAWHAAMRMALEAATESNFSTEVGAQRGLAAARAIGMITYRSGNLFEKRYGRKRFAGGGRAFEVEGYLRHQGRRLVERFDPASYLLLINAMDDFDVGRDRGGVPQALRLIQAEVTVAGISSDLLYPAADMRAFVRTLRRAGVAARYAHIRSDYGHDAFLLEHERVGEVLREALGEERAQPAPAVEGGAGR